MDFPSHFSTERLRNNPRDFYSHRIAKWYSKNAPTWLLGKYNDYSHFIELHDGKTTFSTPKPSDVTIAPYRIIFTSLYYSDQAKSISTGLKKLKNKYAQRFELRRDQDYYEGIVNSASRHDGRLRTNIGWLDLNNTHVSKYFSNAFIDVAVYGTSFIAITASAIPSGRYKYEYRRALEDNSGDWVAAKFSARRPFSPQYTAYPDSYVRNYRINQLSQVSATILSKFLFSYLPASITGKSIWPRLEVLRIKDLQNADSLSHRFWSEHDIPTSRTIAYHGPGYFFTEPRQQVGKTSMSAFRMTIIDEEFISDTDFRSSDSIDDAINFKLHYSLPGLSTFMSLLIQLNRVDNHLNRIAATFLNTQGPKLSGRISIKRIHAMSYRLHLMKNGIHEKILQRTLGTVFGNSMFDTKEYESGPISSEWISLANDRIERLYSKSQSLYETNRQRFDLTMTRAVIIFTLINTLMLFVQIAIGIDPGIIDRIKSALQSILLYN